MTREESDKMVDLYPEGWSIIDIAEELDKPAILVLWFLNRTGIEIEKEPG